MTSILKVNEIFYSCQGEGLDSGLPMTFIRLSGCNLKCPWCDTKYALTSGKATKIKDILEHKASKGTRFYITGGEPLLQSEPVEDLVIRLLWSGNKVRIATNGTIGPPEWQGLVNWDVDRKCPSSGTREFNDKWLHISGAGNSIKFVIASLQDLDFAIGESSRFKVMLCQPQILLSPAIPCKKVLKKRIWEACCDLNVRYSFQVHKGVFGDRKGV